MSGRTCSATATPGFLVLLLYYSCVRSHIAGFDFGPQLCKGVTSGEVGRKVHGSFLYVSLQPPVNLQLFKKIFMLEKINTIFNSIPTSRHLLRFSYSYILNMLTKHEI